MTKTPYADDAINDYSLITQDNIPLHETIVQGQKEIMECILTKQSPDGKPKIHVMAHTRYGKSIVVGAGVAIRAAMKQERWAIVAPTKEQAQIIMDYVIYFAVNDPILSGLLKTSAKILKHETLTQRRSRNHITFLKGGEVRTYSAGQTMGQGAPNLILDEAAITTDEEEAKIFRMLGDNPTDYFIMKIGNPFHNNHFKQAYIDDTYHHINIDSARGLAEGRLSQEILNETKKKPLYGVLYENLFPDEEERDEWGYLPLVSHSLLERAMVDPNTIESMGDKKAGGDPADGGENESVIVVRSQNLAEIKFRSTTTNTIEFASEVALFKNICTELHVDKQGVGAGTVRLLAQAKETKRKLVEVNSGLPLTKDTVIKEGEDFKDFANLRAYMFWQVKTYLEQGGRLVRDDAWRNLLAVKYKTNKKGQIQIVSKDELRKNYKVHDLGVADALSYTFNPNKPMGVFKVPKGTPLKKAGSKAGIEPFYPGMGI